MRILRYKRSDIFMCLSFFIVFFIIFSIIECYNEIIKEKDITDIQSYYNDTSMYIISNGEKISFSNLINETEGLCGIIIIEDCPLMINEISKEYMADIVIFQDEGYKICQDNQKVMVELNKEAVVGAALKKYIHDGKLIVSSKEVNVLAVEDENANEAYSHNITIGYNALSDAVKDRLDERESWEIAIKSDKYDSLSIAKNIKNYISEKYPDITVSINEETQQQNELSGETNTFYFILLYIFCILNCAIAAEFWVLERKEEMAIRRAFGYSAFKLYWSVFIEYLKIVMLVMVLSTIIKIVLTITTKETFSTNGLSSDFLFLIVAAIFTALMTITVPLIRVIKSNNIDYLIKKG